MSAAIPLAMFAARTSVRLVDDGLVSCVAPCQGLWGRVVPDAYEYNGWQRYSSSHDDYRSKSTHGSVREGTPSFVGRKGLFSREEPLIFAKHRSNHCFLLPLLDDDFHAAVLGTSRWRVVAGDRVAVRVACGR